MEKFNYKDCHVPRLINPEYTFLYIMRNNRNGYFKIGSSKNPKYRERTLQAEDPDVTLLYVWECNKIVEKNIHGLYAWFRLRGEWFKFTDQQIESAVRWINQYVVEMNYNESNNLTYADIKQRYLLLLPRFQRP